MGERIEREIDRENGGGYQGRPKNEREKGGR